MCYQVRCQIIFLLLYQESNFLSGKYNVYFQVYNVNPCIRVLGAGLNPRKDVLQLSYSRKGQALVDMLGKSRVYSNRKGTICKRFNVGKSRI